MPKTYRRLLADMGQNNQAPDRVLDLLRAAPTGREYVRVEEVWEDIGGGHERARD